MLYADKNALRTNLKVNMLRIRERELMFFTNNCLSISTSAALLAGFAWYGLTEVPFESDANVVVQTAYLVVTTLIMGLELLTVVNATLCAILGPGLALRGPDGSMHTAVAGMMTHYRRAQQRAHYVNARPAELPRHAALLAQVHLRVLLHRLDLLHSLVGPLRVDAIRGRARALHARTTTTDAFDC